MVQPTKQPCTSTPGSRGQDHIFDVPLAYVYRSALSRELWRLALSKLEKIFEVRKDMVPAWWAMSFYFSDQLMTPYFSGASTLNGTPCGDRWAGVRRGQIGWLSEPLYQVDADCSGCTNLKMRTHGKNTEKSPPHPKPTRKASAARRPRRTRDAM